MKDENPPIKHFLYARNAQLLFFDFDGTVALSEPLGQLAYEKTCQAHGYNGTITDEQWARCSGNTDERIVETLSELHGIDYTVGITTQDFIQERLERYHPIAKKELHPYPYIDEISKYKSETGARCVLITRNYEHVVAPLLIAMRIDDIFDEALYRIEDKADAIARELSRAGVGKEKAILFEDSAATIAKCVAAGITCVGIKHRYNRNEIDESGCLLTIDGEELQSTE